jgi:hypothetical protein
MEPGFVLDYSYGAILPLRWTEGSVEKNFLGNVKTKGRRQIPITADRCTRCGYLDLYARP